MRECRVVHSRDEMLSLLEAVPPGQRFAVMTMGALHAGHASLIERARAEAGEDGLVIVTVYVNALQFNDVQDLARYPRTLDSDADVAAATGADVVWAPSAIDVFPTGPSEFDTDPGALGDIYEGAHRPGHFRGMLTVVRAFLNALEPAVAYFGEKDYQQLALIKQMARDLKLETSIVGVPTLRESDGLALSSRNVFLTASQRAQALGISRALFAGQSAAAHGRAAVFEAVDAVLQAYMIDPDYRALVGEDFIADTGQHARMLIAAKVGDVRLIDNIAIELTPQTPLDGTLAADAKAGR